MNEAVTIYLWTRREYFRPFLEFEIVHHSYKLVIQYFFFIYHFPGTKLKTGNAIKKNQDTWFLLFLAQREENKNFIPRMRNILKVQETKNWEK